MCYRSPNVFPRVLASEIFRIDVIETLESLIPAFITGSLHHVPIWFDEFQYHQIYEICVAGIHRHYEFDDIVWDVVLIVTLTNGRYFLILMPMINNSIRNWNSINFYDVYRNIVFYPDHCQVVDALHHQGHMCNVFVYYEGCETLIVPRRTLDDYLLVPDDEHERYANVVTLQ